MVPALTLTGFCFFQLAGESVSCGDTVIPVDGASNIFGLTEQQLINALIV